ncbi:MAG: helix-turn-helix domain-containing protein [Clostridia bacterium]|nr:helix-turn-helix domain-containing protein [Clostridia bacterium]
MNQRILTIADAAARLFLRQGYGKTQISHIARAAGISVGAVYLDFSGKQAILHFILKSVIDPQFAGRELARPIADGCFPGIEDEIAGFLDRSADEWEARLRAGDMGFEALLSDLFDLFSRYAVGLLFIERNSCEFPALAARYVSCRGRFLDALERHIRALMAQGAIRPQPRPELTALLIVETLSWWAMDVRYTAFEAREIAPELTRQVCLDNLLSAYAQSTGATLPER